MSRFEHRFKVDLHNSSTRRQGSALMMMGDANGDRILVEVYSKGVPYPLTNSSIQATVILPNDNSLFPISGELVQGSSHICYVDLPESAYLIPGPIRITIKNVSSDNVTTLLQVLANVSITKSGSTINPGSLIPVPTWENVEAKIGALDSSIAVVDSVIRNSAIELDSDAQGVDLDISDQSGNVIMRLAYGEIETKNFSSADISSRADYMSSEIARVRGLAEQTDLVAWGAKSRADSAYDLAEDVEDRVEELEQHGGGDVPHFAASDAQGVDLDISDPNGNVILRLKDGGVSTKEFESSYIRQLSGKKWVVIGDSLTEHNQRATKNYHDYVAEETGITVVNLGKSGRGYVAGRDDNTNFMGKVASIPSDTDVITIFGSGNDKSLITSSFTLGDITDTGNTTICGYINQTFDAIYAAFPLIPLGVITPTPWENSEPSDGNTTMAQYCEKLVQICARRGIPCLDLYHCSNLHPDDSSFRAIAYSRDEGHGTHPDENGHKFIAPRFREFLFTLI